MPIRPPALDDRGFADLVADMLRRVPAHTPEWTDLREGDPGRRMSEPNLPAVRTIAAHDDLRGG